MYQFSEQLNNTVSPVVRPSLQSRFTNSVKRAAPPASAIGTHATFRSDPYVGHGNFSNVPVIGHDHDSAELLPRLEAFRSCNVRKVDKRPLQKFRISRTLPGQIRRASVCKHNLRIHCATETFLLDYFTRSQLAFLLRNNASLIGSVYVSQHRLAFQIQSAAADLRRSVYLSCGEPTGRARGQSARAQHHLRMGRGVGNCLLEAIRLRSARPDLRAAPSQVHVDLPSADRDIGRLWQLFPGGALFLRESSIALTFALGKFDRRAPRCRETARRAPRRNSFGSAA